MGIKHAIGFADPSKELEDKKAAPEMSWRFSLVFVVLALFAWISSD
ncbi:MAG: hypothetical protein H7240_04560 [Glaciimonas sp.]|nr:hypothetical protein [Glaciimonas sp.]